MKKRFASAAKTLRFIFCVEAILAFTGGSILWAQTPEEKKAAVATSTAEAPKPNPNTGVYVWSTPTWTYTWGALETATPTPVWMPTATYTITSTFTHTITGTIQPTATPTASPTATPIISRASLALLSTAYSNAWDHSNGFNWDIAFSYYIGAIAAKENSSPNMDFLEPARFALLTSDVKYAWLDEKGDIPAIANGVLLSLIAQLGSGNSSTGASGNQSFNVSGNIMGAVYGVVSKTIFPQTAVHFGYIQGLREASDSLGLGIVSMNYSDLLSLLTPKLQEVMGQSSPGIFYTGFSTRFWNRNWKFEIWKPFSLAQNPVLFNAQVDGLPLAFNLGYERWDNGYALLGYVNFRFTLVPVPPAY
jgi:hypothetical protein